MDNRGVTSRLLEMLLDRPAVGAKGIFRSFFARHFSSRMAEWLFGNASWLLIGLVFLITSLPLPHRVGFNYNGIYVILAVYTLYVFFLEFASRRLRSEYDRTSWHVARIVVNIAVACALLWFSGGVQSYFWFVYLLPLFQAIVYFSFTGVLYTLWFVLASYGALAWLVAARTGGPADPVLLLVNSVVLSLSALVFYTLFGSAREGDELNYKEMEALRLTALDLTAELELDQLLRKIIQRAVELLEAGGGGIYRIRPSNYYLHL